MEHGSNWYIHNVHLILENSIDKGALTVEDGIIAAVHIGEEAEAPEGATVIDGEGGYMLPGFIDMHVHGGDGSEYMNISLEGYEAISRFHASQGTTGLLATTVTASREDIEGVLACAAEFQEHSGAYARLIGVHLEGPFISPKWPGAQNPAYIAKPQLSWVKSWNEHYPGLIRQLTLAPEAEGAMELISWLDKHGIIAAAGHTDADYETIVEAAEHGLSQAVHVFNAMTPLHHRKPGTAGAVLTQDSICAEVIADGHHVHPAAIRLLLKAKPAEQVVLITDAMSAAGLGDGCYKLGELDVHVKGGVATLAKEGNLAGSTLTMIQAFRYILEHSDLEPWQASRLASGNPARRLHIWEQTGSIAEGKLADLVWTDNEFRIRKTWVSGLAVNE
ncbi:N-acetylglucosamine-6-phosphate deacetylase [Paenibacillus sp. GCM10012307]|uniref:N-acetylglucosamine-6-phosphate deacetylase n=1 Tax=Paenibacillus roseus TaxID=2798579 RepID=A0A934J2D5_9BACL|nr:N-acetylglucosamine-6-phosphate deacetylase [Paenibacillus roseus]MBJ6362024.1 N-acetylglucosamine-6-phosphate deacetylase [Paenibacillus roseus]